MAPSEDLHRAAELMAAAAAARSTELAVVASTKGPLEAAGVAAGTRDRLLLAAALAEAARQGFARSGGSSPVRELKTSPSRDWLVDTAVLAMQANRPKDAMKAMNQVSELGCNLSITERSLFLLSTADCIVSIENSLQFLSKAIRPHTTQNETVMIVEYRKKIKAELMSTCLAQMSILEKHLIHSSVGESAVLYLRMKAYCLGVIAQVDPSNPMHKLKSLGAYVGAFEKAETELCPSNGVRLQAAADLGAFLLEIMKDPKSVYPIARKALNEAKVAIDVASGDFSALKPVLNELIKQVRQSSFAMGELDQVPFYYRSPELRMPKIGTRKCVSCGADTSLMALPRNYEHPDVNAYDVDAAANEQDRQMLQRVLDFSQA